MMTALALVLALGASPTLVSCAAPSSLLGRARFVADTRTWWGWRFFEGVDVQWVSDRVLLHARYTGVRNRSPMLAQRPGEKRVIYRLDIATGRERPLRELSRTIDGFETEVVDSQKISPDGRWLLRSDRWGDCLLAEVSGRERHTYPSPNSGCYRTVHWFADSRRWIENLSVNGRTDCMVLHDVRHPGLSRAIPVGGKACLFGALARCYSMGRAIAIWEPSRDIDGAEKGRSVTISECSLNGSRPTRKLGRIDVPRGSGEFRCSLSPGGDRLAWYVSVRLPRDVCRGEMWVCDVDGTHMRLLGSITRSGIAADDAAGYIDVNWLPSGRGLWFVYNDRLYTLAVSSRRAGRSAGAR